MSSRKNGWAKFLALVEETRGEATLYDLSTIQSLAHFTFPAHVLHAEFSNDGVSIFLLTEDQFAYQLKATAPETKTATE